MKKADSQVNLEFNRQGYYHLQIQKGPVANQEYVIESHEQQSHVTDLRQHESIARSLKRPKNAALLNTSASVGSLVPVYDQAS